MSIYTDSRVKIFDNKIIIYGAFAPGSFSKIDLTTNEIDKIRKVKLSTWDRLNLLGTNDLKSWWCFDFKRPMREYGLVIELKESIGPFHAIGFTADNSDQAYKAITSNMRSPKQLPSGQM